VRRAEPHEYRRADGIRRAALGQPAGHRLADIDWRQGEITVRGKGSRASSKMTA